MSRPGDLDVDIAVVGGGIAGLWLLSRLRSRGYGALLVESDRLGAGQSICSQGIIHGGAKYALTGHLSGTGRLIGTMPGVWRRCLAGTGEVDLSAARVLSPYQYLWTAGSLGSRLTGFFANQAMGSRMVALAPRERPPLLADADAFGSVYRLDEPVVDVASVLLALARCHGGCIVHSPAPVVDAAHGTLTLQSPERDPLRLVARRIVCTAGVGNQDLGGVPMQRRPLHMVMLRGQALPGDLFAHCLGSGSVPRLTVTTHRDRDQRPVWYVGGQLAEEGVARNGEAQIAVARGELARLLPQVDFRDVEFAALRIDRAEARQRAGRRPDGQGLFGTGRCLTAWPTKLALAPMLADAVIAWLEADGIFPEHEPGDSALADWPAPRVAAYPWDREEQTWC